jgi:AhpC/TSA family
VSIPIESKGSLRQLFADLQAQRVRALPPGELQINVNQRRQLEETAERARFVKVGDVLEPFSLPEVYGGVVTLDGILASGPAVLIFFRFAGCPACNTALPYYQRQIIPEPQELGITVVAISPQVPERLVEIKRRYPTFQSRPMSTTPRRGNWVSSIGMINPRESLRCRKASTWGR